jgi:hypothetical protein
MFQFLLKYLNIQLTNFLLFFEEEVNLVDVAMGMDEMTTCEG